MLCGWVRLNLLLLCWFNSGIVLIVYGDVSRLNCLCLVFLVVGWVRG